MDNRVNKDDDKTNKGDEMTNEEEQTPALQQRLQNLEAYKQSREKGDIAPRDMIFQVDENQVERMEITGDQGISKPYTTRKKGKLIFQIQQH